MQKSKKLRILGVALVRLVEANQRTKALAKRAKIEKALERAMAIALVAQGADFVKRLKRLADRFPIKEAKGPKRGEWEPIIYETFEATGDLFTEPIATAINGAFKTGASAVVHSVDISFDLKNPRAEAWLKDRAAERVTMINNTTRKELAKIINQGIADGESYSSVARRIVDRFEEMAVGKPQEHVASRAHLIAMTEVGEAYAEGNLQMGEQLEDAGISMEKSWLTSGDDRVSAGCLDNAAVGWIPIGQEFPSGHQRPLRFPGCRCDILMQQTKDSK